KTIADVNQNGFLVALRPGTITLTGTTLDGTNLSDTAIVEVIESSANTLLDITITISDATATEGESLSFTASLSEPSDTEIFLTVDYNNDTATDADYNLLTPELSFAPGETQKSILVEALTDDIKEQDEMFSIEVNVKEPLELSKGAINAIGTIIDKAEDVKSIK
ncbi:unnamed protein product, partial [Ectocarpus fasciculatus]